jgi:hypothetical protein
MNVQSINVRRSEVRYKEERPIEGKKNAEKFDNSQPSGLALT